MHLMKDQNASFGTEFPKNLEPMLATAGTLEGLDSQEWAFEGKWDGIRVILEYHSGTMSLRSRAGNDKTGGDYPALAGLAEVLDGHDVVLDGEVVAYNDAGGSPISVFSSEVGGSRCSWPSIFCTSTECLCCGSPIRTGAPC